MPVKFEEFEDQENKKDGNDVEDEVECSRFLRSIERGTSVLKR